MFHFLKQPKRFLDIFNFIEVTNKRFISILRPSSCIVNYSLENRLLCKARNKSLLVSNDPIRLILARNKYQGKGKKRIKKDDYDSSDDEEEEGGDDDDDDDGNLGAQTYSVNSVRCDNVLKSVLAISRKSVEEAFYNNKIRINGGRLIKKSQNVEEGDEIDIIKTLSPELNTLTIGRVKIMGIKFDKETGKILIKAVKHKSLKVKNYSGVNTYRDAM